jgi:antibiotic biosynthesis monooxygenase (ABM) superfamily enzyme
MKLRTSHAAGRRHAHSHPSPPRYKLALVTWAGAYPIITLIFNVLGPRLAAWPLALRTLAVSALMVISLTWLVIPVLTRLLRGWLMQGRTPVPM